MTEAEEDFEEQLQKVAIAARLGGKTWATYLEFIQLSGVKLTKEEIDQISQAMQGRDDR